MISFNLHNSLYFPVQGPERSSDLEPQACGQALGLLRLKAKHPQPHLVFFQKSRDW